MKKRPYIMVVDDDQEMMRMLKRTLNLEGYNVSPQPLMAAQRWLYSRSTG